MSEVRSRPSVSRSRGSARGGRGSYNARGGRGSSRHTNGDLSLAEPSSYEDEGELGQLKKLYMTKLSTMKEMFPDWTDEDLVFALQETDGNLENTVERIYEGNISQWGEVKKKTKDRSQSKVKDSSGPLNDATNHSNRGGRGRGGPDGARGGRGRGSERGRGAGRGGRGGSSVNGSRTGGENKGPPDTAPAGDWGASDFTPPKVEAEGGWDQPTETENATMESSWENIAVPDVSTVPTAELPKASSKPDGTRSWASIFNKPAPVPTPPKAPQPPPTHEASVEELIAPPPAITDNEMAALPPPIAAKSSGTQTPTTPPASDLVPSEPPAEITPSKDELTETNLEQVLDTSGPPASATAASTVASTVDPRGAVDSATPLHGSQQSSSRPPLGGYATTAYKAAGLPGRSASFQRKILEQEEAVVMPGKHAVDRTAVQFGSMGLNGTTEDLDVDSDREEAETRAQPPQHSPIAPRAALPPAPQQQAFPSQPPVSEPLPTPRQAPGLPPVSQQPTTQQPSQPASTEPAPSQSQSNHPYNQFNNRYGQAGQPEASAPAQKAYEPFGQQVQPQQQHQYEGYPSSQAPAQSQTQAQSHSGGYSSASNESSSYYTSDNQRNAYQNYYGGNYGQSQPSLQEAGAAQQRIGSAFGTTVGEQGSHHVPSQAQPHPQARYGQTTEAPTSGNSTPNPSVPNQQQQNQPQQAHQIHQQQQAQGQGGGQHSAYPYGHPYYTSPYFSAYMNQVSAHPYGRERPMFDDVRRYDDQYLTHNPQFGYGGNHGGYGGGPFGGGAGGKQGMYGQPHQGYGMSPQQSSYDQHSSSPANVGGFAQQQSVPSREGAAGGTLASYGRSGSAQPSENQQQYSGASGGGYGNMPDVFARSGSGFPGQAQGVNHQVGGQSGANDDARGGYSDSAKVPGGPSPALGQPGGRPGSAVNSLQGQTGLPPPQSQSQQNQQGYGGYPGLVNHQMQQHGQQGSQYGAGPPGGGLGGHHGSAGQQTHQGGGGYGAYGAGNTFGASYYGGGGNSRGGWGGNYGGH